ncbi:hypothetical protein SAMN05444166_1882 [Singulisphaera sp. GP187]|uniref:hypothetical protein n=1 Tax=Singulisphaera sp. GP187 TaxID=1882752 RepID=UPI00092B9CEF|nr:hypothetical protein [Singulisphaera sp. GP187]SIN97883.1 hypothetical protein SAMN05444166_1882 [Singulisphaera sp. GP187]
MAMTTTKRKRKAKVVQPPPEDPVVTHAATFERYRNLAADLTRQAIEAYTRIRAEYVAMEAMEYAILGEFPERHPKDAKADHTEDQFKLLEHTCYWGHWTQDKTNLLLDAENCLVRSILNWDRTLDRDALEAGPASVHAPRGVIHNGSLYLAIPDDDDKSSGLGWTTLRVVPLASIVDLDTTGDVNLSIKGGD